MTVEQLGAIAGVILSLAFSYIPGLKDRFSALDSIQQSLIMAVLLLLVALGALALSCTDIVSTVECSKAGIVSLINIYIAALVANQAMYVISPHKSGKSTA